MPVDIAAATLEQPAGTVPGTSPMGPPPAFATNPVIAQGRTAGGAVESAPTVAGGITASHLTPLGTAVAPPVAKKSRAGLAIGLGLFAVLAIAAAAVGPRLLHEARGGHGSEASITPVPTGLATGAPTTTSTTNTTNTTNATPPPSAHPNQPMDPKQPKHTSGTPTTRGAAGKTPPVEPPPTSAAVAAPAPSPPAPDPPPPATTAAPAPPPPAAPTPPPAPAFNPQTCKATPGTVRSTGATNSKDLSMNGTAGAWTACAQRSIQEKPGAPITGSVHLSFSDNGAFRGATCAGCPAPLAQCIASSTGRTVALKIRGGDVTGEPGFEVPVTVTCD
jgi:hypothetical protein